MVTVRVLLAADNDVVAQQLESLLQENAYEILRVSSGREALARLNSERFDALIGNWELPFMSGLELIRQVRATVHPCPPILMLAAQDSEDAFNIATRAGADDTLNQPIDPQQVLTRLRVCVARYRQAYALQGSPASDSPVSQRPSRFGHRPNPSPQLPRRSLLGRKTVRMGSQLGVAPAAQALPSCVCLAICAGFGGIDSLEGLLAQLATPSIRRALILVAMHDRSWIRAELPERLERQLNLPVRWAAAATPVGPGQLHIAAGNGHLTVQSRPLLLQLINQPAGICPSADWLFRSMSSAFGPYGVAVVLSGVGDDGARGAALVASSGGVVLVQGPKSSGLSGIPQSTVSMTPTARQLPLESLGDAAAGYVGELSRQLEVAQMA